MSSSDKIKDLLDELDESYVEKLSHGEILELRKQLNPYGRTIEGSGNILTFSYVDLRKSYLKKMVVTAAVGFLHRMCDEWNVPDGLPVIPVEVHDKNPEKLKNLEDKLSKTDEKIQSEIKENREWMKKRFIIREFLDDMFQFNPDIHVKSAYRPQPKDGERTVLNTPAAKLAIKTLKEQDSEFKETMFEYDRKNKADVKKTTSVKETTSAKETNPVKETMLDASTPDYITENIPPNDTFSKFSHYMDSNYESLQNAVYDLYCEKPYYHTAVNPYSWHNTPDDADNFINKHKEEVITTVHKGHSGKWNIIAPFEQVRDSTRFFNDKTIILEEMAKQIEQDSKTANGLMDNRIKKKKKQNIDENGPDDPAFTKWKEQNPTLKKYNMDSKINASSHASDECPDDAVEVPVYRVSAATGELTKSKFFTKAVAPKATNM
jgi:hypothetical protein